MSSIKTLHAADLGGGCCADLEYRVAELEATTVRKGNRKVSLAVSGHVREEIAFWVDGNETNACIDLPNFTRSRFRFTGQTFISADWPAGFLMGFGLQRNNLSKVSQNDSSNTTGVDIRHEALHIISNTFGSVWLGWASSATDGIAEINLGGTSYIAKPDASNWLGGFLLTLGSVGSRQVACGDLTRWTKALGEGDRRNIVCYNSPTLAGFSQSVPAGGDDFWDVDLRYSGEFDPIGVAAGIGCQRATDFDDVAANYEVVSSSDSDVECDTLGMWTSMMHDPTGLYISGAYGRVEDNNVTADHDNEDEFFYMTGGIKQKWSKRGKTTILGAFYNLEGGARSISVTSVPGLAGSLGSSESKFSVLVSFGMSTLPLWISM